MIDKILPRLLNSSSDNRLKKATEMNDALNVVATDNFDQGLGGNDNGDAGVLKPVPSNSLAPWKPSRENQSIEDIFPNNEGFVRRTIGSVSDAKAGVVYFFVYSNDTEEEESMLMMPTIFSAVVLSPGGGSLPPVSFSFRIRAG